LKTEPKETARRLFQKLVDMIDKEAKALCWRNAAGQLLTMLRLSMDENYQLDRPWEDVFYLRMCFDGKGPAIPVGIGSLSKNQITLNTNLVPKEIEELLYNRFLFNIIAVDDSFEEIKKLYLPVYQSG